MLINIILLLLLGNTIALGFWIHITNIRYKKVLEALVRHRIAIDRKPRSLNGKLRLVKDGQTADCDATFLLR